VPYNTPRRRAAITARPRLLHSAIAIALLVGTTAPASASDGVTVRAETGLGGAAHPGRWTPVRVAVANGGHDFSGEIVVEWGEARVHRAFEIAAPSRTTVELYIRAQDARGSMVVTLVSNGHAIASADVAIRPVPDNERLIVCVGGAARASADGACTTVMALESLPRSMRGYDSADEVRLPTDMESQLAPEQRAALRRWRAYHDLDVQDLLSRAPQALWTGSPEAAVGWSTRIACLMVLCPLLAAAGFFRRARGSALLTYAALAGATVVAVIGGAIAGRVGPGSAVLIRHATSVQQIADGSVISMRGTIEYPAFDAYAIHVGAADAALTLRSPHRAEQWANSDGAPIHRSTVGRGHREELELEAVGDFAPFAVSVRGDTVRVSNVSGLPLTDCRFSGGLAPADVGTLRPGASSEARSHETASASFFSCAMSDSPVRVSDARFPVRMTGSTIVSVRLPSRATAEDEQ
jgi:hypothetical protein